MRDETCDDRDRKDQGAKRQMSGRAFLRKSVRQKIDDDRADCHPKHRDRDRNEREMKPHRHAEDTGQEDLIHQRAECHEENTQVHLFFQETGLQVNT